MIEAKALTAQANVTELVKVAEPKRKIRARPLKMADPLFVLAPPRSFSSVVSTMLGQHPQMYGLPELQLFGAETMVDWWEVCRRASFPMAHGLLRVVAQLYFSEQTEHTIKLAGAWLRRRSHFSTGMIVEALARRVYPLILVDKSPSIVYSPAALQRAYEMFPTARLIHLLRHPRGHGESVMKAIVDMGKVGPVPNWLLHLASYPDPAIRENWTPEHATDLDPQRGWYALHMNIRNFLLTVPEHQKLRIRGEDLLTDPDASLRQIATWMGLRTDAQAMEEMKHPERSPYACFGPPNARRGNDLLFLNSPVLRPARVRPLSLDGPVSWREDERDFLPEV